MYNEDSFNQHLCWIKIKRIFLLAIFSIIGCVLGIIISSYLVDVLLFSSTFRVLIIAILTLLFFAMALITTSNTGKEIQEGYWKIAVLRKLTLISKKLDYLEKLDNLDIINDLISQSNINQVENNQTYIENNNSDFNNTLLNDNNDSNLNTNSSIQNNVLNISEENTDIVEKPKRGRKKGSTNTKK